MAAQTQWCHKIITTERTTNGGLPDRLESLGCQGWELVAVVGEPGRWTLFLKRPAR
jgi:hypothetical protein